MGILGKLNNMVQKKYSNIFRPNLSMATEYYNEKTNCIILGYDNDLRLMVPITSIKKKKKLKHSQRSVELSLIHV